MVFSCIEHDYASQSPLEISSCKKGKIPYISCNSIDYIGDSRVSLLSEGEYRKKPQTYKWSYNGRKINGRIGQEGYGKANSIPDRERMCNKSQQRKNTPHKSRRRKKGNNGISKLRGT